MIMIKVFDSLSEKYPVVNLPFLKFITNNLHCVDKDTKYLLIFLDFYMLITFEGLFINSLSPMPMNRFYIRFFNKYGPLCSVWGDFQFLL